MSILLRELSPMRRKDCPGLLAVEAHLGDDNWWFSESACLRLERARSRGEGSDALLVECHAVLRLVPRCQLRHTAPATGAAAVGHSGACRDKSLRGATVLFGNRHSCATGGCVATCCSQQVECPLSGMDPQTRECSVSAF